MTTPKCKHESTLEFCARCAHLVQLTPAQEARFGRLLLTVMEWELAQAEAAVAVQLAVEVEVIS